MTHELSKYTENDLREAMKSPYWSPVQHLQIATELTRRMAEKIISKSHDK